MRLDVVRLVARVRTSFVGCFDGVACKAGDDDATRARKNEFAAAMTSIVLGGVVWGALYAAFGAWNSAVLPWSYAVLSGLNLLVLRRTGGFRPYQLSELALIVVLPFLLQLSLGGYVGGSCVVLWALLGPLFAVLYTSRAEAAWWFGAFIVLVVLGALLQPHLTYDNPLPDGMVVAFFVLNVAAPSAFAFMVLASFMDTRERLRDLEVAYFDQAVMLRQREKLATLGTLAAGVAHELNNPAAAVQRAAQQLRPTLASVVHAGQGLLGTPLTAAQVAGVAALVEAPARPAPTLTPVARSMAEGDVEGWLDDHGLPEPWELAATFVSAGWAVDDLEAIEDVVGAAPAGALAALVGHRLAGDQLAGDVAEGSARMSEIVGALKSYAYLDRGTVQLVDVTEGLESTLVLMRAKLRTMQVERAYAEALPRIEVRGNELNQVWTNIIDNAVDATGGTGRLEVRTSLGSAPGGSVVVELSDDGPGMPQAVADRVFDPFFTTKDPGKGTGLGLNITHNIVVRQHGGDISVTSAPGRTTFRIELPVHHEPAPDEVG